MAYLTKVINTVVTLALLTPVIMAIFSFFGIPFETYANYIMWMVALGLFYVIIPNDNVKTYVFKS